MDSNFFQQVYGIVSIIPKGKVATYGQIAALLGRPVSHARVVGWAMRAVPDGAGLPCHRVVNKAGTLAPGYVFGGTQIQRAILENEGIAFNKDGRINMKMHLWKSG